MPEGIICYIGIGSNMGDALQNCRQAVLLLSETRGISLKTVSSFYKTEPVGIEKQPYFVNAVAEIRTSLSARSLLHALQGIESTMGRTRRIKGGPRIIDLDLLFYGQNVIHEEGINVPHPETHRRKFVLEPLCEIASYLIHPSFGVSLRGLKERLTDCKAVERINE